VANPRVKYSVPRFKFVTGEARWCQEGSPEEVRDFAAGREPGGSGRGGQTNLRRLNQASMLLPQKPKDFAALGQGVVRTRFWRMTWYALHGHLMRPFSTRLPRSYWVVDESCAGLQCVVIGSPIRAWFGWALRNK
jgi:hypothetical protein